MRSRRALGAFLTTAGGVCWGISGTMGQYLFQHEGMDSRWLVPIRLGGAGILLLIYALIRYGRKMTFAPWRTKKDAADLIVYGFLGVSCCQFFYFLTIQLSNAGFGTIMQSLSPAVIMVIICARERRAPGIRELLCIALAVAGIVLVVTQGDFSALSVPVTAIITGLLSAVCVTIYNVSPRFLLMKYPVPLLQAWAFCMGSVAFTLIFRPWTIDYTPSPMGIFGIAFVILVGNVAAFVLFMNGVKYIGPEPAVLYGYSEPVVAAILAAVLFGTPVTAAGAAGFVLIFIMLVLISTQKQKSIEDT